MPNLFVQGATAFPQNAGYNPTDTVAALAYLVGRCDPIAVFQKSGASRPCVTCACPRNGCRDWPTAISRCRRRDDRSQDFTQIERGRYLSRHRRLRRLSYAARLRAQCSPEAGSIETPFGRLIAPNITPDPETGIGAWTDEEFVNSLTKGTGRNGTHLYPAMPYTYMTRLTRTRCPGDPRLFQHHSGGSQSRCRSTSCHFRSTCAREW